MARPGFQMARSWASSGRGPTRVMEKKAATGRFSRRETFHRRSARDAGPGEENTTKRSWRSCEHGSPAVPRSSTSLASAIRRRNSSPKSSKRSINESELRARMRLRSEVDCPLRRARENGRWRTRPRASPQSNHKSPPGFSGATKKGPCPFAIGREPGPPFEKNSTVTPGVSPPVYVPALRGVGALGPKTIRPRPAAVSALRRAAGRRTVER